jgi:hypothetical protein
MKFLLLFLSFTVFAQTPMSSNGNGVGNGGDVVTCKNLAELLDFTETKLMKRFTLIEAPKSSYLKIAKTRLEILKKVDPKLAAQYSKVLDSVENRWKTIENATFRDVPDSFEIAIPDECKIEQTAIQQEIDGKTQIHVSKKLWDKLDPMNKAGLVLHEIIYEHFIVLGEKNSVKVRRFNSLLFSSELNRMNNKQYQEYVRLLGLKFY